MNITFENLLRVHWNFVVSVECTIVSKLAKDFFSVSNVAYSFVFVQIKLDRIWPLFSQIRSNSSWCNTGAQLSNWRLLSNKNWFHVLNITFENLLLVNWNLLFLLNLLFFRETLLFDMQKTSSVIETIF